MVKHDALSVTAEICFSAGRSEFVQKLKLEATLNVHDGCVSTTRFHLSLMSLCVMEVCVCIFLGRKMSSFLSERQRERGSRPLKPDADRSDTEQSHHTVSVKRNI